MVLFNDIPTRNAAVPRVGFRVSASLDSSPEFFVHGTLSRSSLAIAAVWLREAFPPS